MSYTPHTEKDIREMLDFLGYDSVDKLFKDIPAKARFKKERLLSDGMSELEVTALMKELSAKNKTVDDYVCFMGGGAYDRFIPAAVDHILTRPEFYTAYTPYQPEVSQGTLQHIYEFQTMVSRIYGMEVANASMYDGASALAEAAIMALHSSKRKKLLIASTINPYWVRVVESYLYGFDVEIQRIDEKNGETDYDDLKRKLDDKTAAVLMQYPNAFGIVEDLQQARGLITDSKTMFVVMADPVASVLIKKPGECGADIVVGEGQQLGIPLSYGGPYLGLFSFRSKYIRQAPGRIIGMTKDTNQNRGFVMTYQTREQHIRREKATSNICTNQGLMTVAAAVYLSLMGKKGLREVAEQSHRKAYYLFKALTALPGIKPAYPGKPFVNEFAVTVEGNAGELKTFLKKKHYLPGILLGHQYPQKKDQLLIAVTEKRTKQEMDAFVRDTEAFLKTGGRS
jgi:glycine dehydrogenase subunit 1